MRRMGHFNLAIDGSIVGLYLLGTMAAGLMVRKYIGRVEDFLVAGREMNVYLGVASLAATEFGIVTCMYTAENGFRYGFAGATPGILYALAMLAVGLTGFCIKPLRQSGVLTLPELFERRFGPRVRRAAGVVIVLGGLLNMGVFLRTGGEFLVQVTGFSLSAAPGAAGLAAWMQAHTLELAMTVLLLMVAFVYKRTQTAELAELGGLFERIPFIAIAFLIGGFSIVGMPGTPGFDAAHLVLEAAIEHFGALPTVAAALGNVAAAGFLLWAFQRAFLAPPPAGRGGAIERAQGMESLIAAVLVVVLLWSGFHMGPWLDLVDVPLRALAERFGHV